MQPGQLPHSENLRHYRQKVGPGTFFVTKCLDPKLSAIGPDAAFTICEALCFYVGRQQIYLGAFVVMLNHWHAVFGTCDGKTVDERKILDHWISRQTSKELNLLGTGWQDGYYETRIRSSRQFMFTCRYVEENPVRAGLVETPSDWHWSTAHPNYRKAVTRPWPWRFEKD